MDFTQSRYKSLLKALRGKGYRFITFYDYIKHYQSANPPIVIGAINPQSATQNPQPGTRNSELGTRNSELGTRNSELGTRNSELQIILRHDVDLRPQNSLVTAEIEHHLGIKGSYYFRMIPIERTLMAQILQIFADIFKSNSASSRLGENPYNPKIFNPDIIRYIAALGHEIGYHYETMDTVSFFQNDFSEGDSPFRGQGGEGGHSQQNRNKKETAPFSANEHHITAAYNLFVQNLEYFRQIANVKTICMHGSPRSKYDNREIWKKYDYKKLGIIGEPYFDLNFEDFFYLTDTGRRWDGHKVSVRDKMPQQERWNSAGLRFRTTKDIIKAANENRLPSKIMITVHPQRWNKSFTLWTKELVFQNAKNIVKRIIVGIS